MKQLSVIIYFLMQLLACPPMQAQRLTLDNAIRIAQENSYSAQVAQFSYMASYLNYRSFKAQLMPAVSLRGKVANFDHSLIETRNYEDGRLNYVNNNTMSNYLTLSIDQQIAAIDGTVSLQSYLYRLDQFSYDETTWNSEISVLRCRQLL